MLTRLDTEDESWSLPTYAERQNCSRKDACKEQMHLPAWMSQTLSSSFKKALCRLNLLQPTSSGQQFWFASSMKVWYTMSATSFYLLRQSLDKI